MTAGAAEAPRLLPSPFAAAVSFPLQSKLSIPPGSLFGKLGVLFPTVLLLLPAILGDKSGGYAVIQKLVGFFFFLILGGGVGLRGWESVKQVNV